MGESFSERLHLPYYDYIPQRGLTNLSKYKYSGLDLSLIAKYILHPFWTWLANYLPEWPAYVHSIPHYIIFTSREAANWLRQAMNGLQKPASALSSFGSRPMA